MKYRTPLVVAVMITPLVANAKTAVYLYHGAGRFAVDANGVRHSAKSYGEHERPWDADRIKPVAPEYPRADRAQRHAGSGLFRVHLDLKTGSVTSVAVVQSIGFCTLDAAAVRALRQWRWRPGKWKEIDIPVTFILTQHE